MKGILSTLLTWQLAVLQLQLLARHRTDGCTEPGWSEHERVDQCHQADRDYAGGRKACHHRSILLKFQHLCNFDCTLKKVELQGGFVLEK